MKARSKVIVVETTHVLTRGRGMVVLMFGHSLEQITHLKHEVADDPDQVRTLLLPGADARVLPRADHRR